MEILESPIFYMGNKYKLLKQLLPIFPKECDTFLDVFGGSGVVCMNYKGNKRTIYNEYNPNIVNLFKMFKEESVEELDKYFVNRIKEFDLRCISKNYREEMYLQEGYYNLRDYYNKSTEKDIRDLYLLICYSINHLIRFNKKNEFNVGCGKTQRYIKEKIVNMHNRVQDVEVLNMDYLDLPYEELTENDFVYFDPPYTNTEAVYNEKRAYGGWTEESDKELFLLCEMLDIIGVKWGFSNVFQNRGKVNQHLMEWCSKNGWKVYHLSRNYHPFSKSASNSDEVYICNY